MTVERLEIGPAYDTRAAGLEHERSEMGFLDKAKAAAEQAAAKAKEGVEDVQLKRELGQAYGELGKKAFELVESGGLSHPQLDEVVAKIRTLNEKAGSDEESEAAPETPETGEPPPAAA